jgi:hypothetical protein
MGLVTLYDSKTGQAFKVEPCDAREMLAPNQAGQYTRTDPKAPAPEPGAALAVVGLRMPPDMAAEFNLGAKKISAANLAEAARVASKLSPEEWNAQTNDALGKLMGQQYETAKAQALAASLTPSAKPAK